ncbi:uncharacterized protein LOC121895850 isoform X1 [Scomber scombrus]|uniref:Uncharacterized protein LOC121895850 isoform X1 n=1 Tax=Scomber scombrus TaxID=13677 RepID=A0AAV1PXK3_SCOSC
MAALLSSVLLLLSGSVLPDPFAGPGPSTGSGPDSEQGRMQLRRVRSLATQSRYGECWARALENLDTRCKDMTSESQSQIALRFTHCHLSSTGRDFPSCPEGSEVSRCTAGMDAVAFNAYTEFFTHTHSICHFLQSEAWQSRAESTMHRLTESSAGVVEQLLSTRQMAEDLIEVQSAALQTQQEILNNGEELRVTLKDSTQGLKSVFSDLSSVSRQQQVALSELFNRVSFLQSFMMTEAHSLGSCLYNAAALCASFLLTSTQRTSKARLLLLAQVCLNFYLERKIWQYVMSSDHPEHKHMELMSVYVSVLRRSMVCVGVCVLLFVCVRYRDPVQQSLQVLQQLKETQRSLQEALQQAESLGQRQEKTEEIQQNVKKTERRRSTREATPRWRKEELRIKEEEKEEEEECSTLVSPTTDSLDLSHLSHTGWSTDSMLSSTLVASAADTTLYATHNALVQRPTTHSASVQRPTTHNASVSPGRRPRRSSSSSSPLVYSILVEDGQRRYSLRNRRSETH